MQKYHYVYKIINRNPIDSRKYYIGVRSSIVKPEEDTKYMSSSKYLKEAIRNQGVENFSKEILSTFSTREDAQKEEVKIHEQYNVGLNESFYNKYNSRSSGYCVYGYVTVKDTKTGEILNVLKKDYYESDCYEHITVGKVVVTEKKNGIRKQVSSDEYYKNRSKYKQTMDGRVVVRDTLTDETTSIFVEEYHNNRDRYMSCNTGMLNATDKKTNTKVRITVEEFRNNLEKYSGTTSGEVTVKHVITGETKNITIEEFKKSNEYVTVASSIIKFYDENGVYQFSNDCQIDKFLEKQNMPVHAFKVSFRNNGSKLYLNEINQSNWTRITQKGHDRFRGWFAIKV